MKRIIIPVSIIILIVSALLYIGFNIDMFEVEYTYTNKMVPSTVYYIRVNKLTKELNGDSIHYSSVDFISDYRVNYSIKLTNEEYKNIMRLWDDKEKLSPILEYIGGEDKILFKTKTNAFEDAKKDYDKIDINKDGQISNREYGDYKLKKAE